MSGERSDLAAWLQAVDQLKPQNEEAFEVISRLLGVRLKAPGKKSVGPRQPIPRPPAEPKAAEARLAEEPIKADKPRRRIETVLAPSNASRNPAPHWLAAARNLETTEDTHIRAVLPLDPLFPARTSRAIISAALATPFASGAVDLMRVIDMVSRAELIEHIPWLSIPTLVRGVQLLIDRGESMQPFAADQAALRTALSRVVGRDRTEVLYFDGSPLWGAGNGPKDEWLDYHTPAPGTPVLVLTDLGITQPPGIAGLAGPSDWRAFAKTLARAGCPLLALVPYPPRRWPGFQKCMTILQWDRVTTAAVVRRAVPSGLRIAKDL